MIKSINEYTLDTDVNAYGNSLLEFGKDSYKWGKKYGIVPSFKSERFFWIKDDWFLGKKSNLAYLSAINNKIYKISFSLNSSESHLHGIGSMEEDRKKMYDFVFNEMGKHTDSSQLSFTWRTDEGIVIINHISFATMEITLVSNAINNAKKLSFFDNLFQ